MFPCQVADPAFLIRGGGGRGGEGLIQKFSWQVLGKCSKKSTILYYQKFIKIYQFYVLPLCSYNYKKLSLYKPVYKNLFLVTCHFFDTFLSGLFLKPKLSKCFLCFRFDIYFKINLVLSLGQGYGCEKFASKKS